MTIFTARVTRLAALLGLGGALPAFAADDSGVTISGATLTNAGITFANFAGVTLNGTQRTTTASWAIGNTVDPRGTGAGWNVSLTLTPLAEYNVGLSAYVSSGQALAASSIRVTTAPNVSQVDVTSSPANTVTPVATGTALDTCSPVSLASAALNGGMGSYAFSNLTATLTIPASAYVATYKTDATVSINAVP